MSCAITIGKFESIHLGHRALLTEVKQQAAMHGLSSAAIIFDPHPHTYFSNAEYKSLFTFAEREHILPKLDHVHYLPFDKMLAELTPQAFCKLLFETYNAKIVIVGENFRFGKDRAGDISTLQAEAMFYNAAVHVMPPSCSNMQQISTSGIRHLIAESNITGAAQLLGFPFFMMGVAEQGKQLGHTLGFPTLNIYPSHSKFLPPNGVYISQTTINDAIYSGITNIGVRPTVSNTQKISVETHMPEYTGQDLYGVNAKVELLSFVRTERRFASIDELKAQIAEDIKAIK